MEREKKSFGSPQSGGGDFDGAPIAIAPNSWINMENCRTLTTDAGETDVVESIGSTVLINNPSLPATGINLDIGKAEDEANQRTVYFIWNSLGFHNIFCYDGKTGIIYLLLTDAQVVGGLLFDKNHLIHSARVINGSVYWCNDTQTDPRRFNIDAAIKLNQPSYSTSVAPYTAPLNTSVIAWIRRQPGLPPMQTKLTQTIPLLRNNFIKTGPFQFAYRYVHREYENSTISGYSTSANYNADTDTFNRIDVTIPFAEKIDQDVIQVDIIVIYLDTFLYSIIRSFKKNVPADLTAINNHNSGISQLSYAFYNDSIGIPLDSAYSVKPFDSVPIFAQTIETAKNRAFFGNYAIGYDTPKLSSLAISFVTTQMSTNIITNITGHWYLIKYRTLSPFGGNFSHYVISTTSPIGPIAPGPAYFYEYIPGGVPPFPANINDSDLLFVGHNPYEVALHYNPSGSPYDLQQIDQSATSIILISFVPPSNILGKAFKSDASYQLSIHFMDNSGRKSGVFKNDSLIMYVPDTGMTLQQFVLNVNWLLSNANALNEIPIWAYYYSINITKCLRTRFFLQSEGTIVYAKKDATGAYTFTTTVYSTNLAGVAIDLTFLQSHAQGYQFTIGDIVKLVIGTNEYVMSIVDQAAQYIICQLTNVGSLATVNGFFEIYTPYKRQTNEPNYEVFQIFPVANAGTNTRQYSSTGGSIAGDIYLISRTNSGSAYITEAMNQNDKYYTQWVTDAGRPNFVDDIGQVIKKNTYAFSNTYIPGSKNNGLSTFEALNTKESYPESGAIIKLQLTSKVAGAIGDIMLSICEEETESLYLGEVQLLSATDNAFVAKDAGVIGTINVLKGSFGTIHPESVVEFRGNVFFFNAKNGKYIQYSGNGLFPISNYKMTRYWKLFSEQFLSMTQAQIEALGSRPFIFSCVDPHNWELLVTVPKLLSVPPKGYLPDYPNMVYPFDIWDGQSKTLVYKLNAEPNHWSGAYAHTPEGMTVLNNKVFGFKNGNLYKHGSTSDYTINIYGVVYKARIMFVGNSIPNKPKVYNNISVEGNMKPSLTYFRTEPSLSAFDRFDLPEQASDLMDFDYEVKEGQLYSFIYRNKLVPTESGLNLTGLLTAEKIRALTLKVLLEFSPTNQPLQLRFVTLGFSISRGHST